MAALPLALFEHQATLLLSAAAAAGAGQGLTHRASQAALLEAAPANSRGQVAAAFYLTGYLAVAVILISLEILIDTSGPLVGLAGFAALTVSGSSRYHPQPTPVTRQARLPQKHRRPAR
ncbi:MAG: hypothetical protein ACYC91_18815 [Solirubrobacteraceae bacterium]